MMNYDSEIEITEARCDFDHIAWRFNGTTAQECAKWQEETRKKLGDLLTLDTCERTGMKVNLRSSSKEPGYIKDLCEIETEPGVWMPFYLLHPEEDGKKHPALLIPHGHYPNGKESTVDNTDGDGFATQFAKKGYYVFCPDARGAGERLRARDKKNGLTNSHKTLFNVYLGAGRVLIGLMIWDLMRLLDYAETLSAIDVDRIGCVGMSGGGQQSIFFAALDPRIKAASTSGYFYGYKEALLEQPGNCSCNFVPGIWGKIDMGDIGALIAPRPFHIESGERDGLNGKGGIGNVKSQVAVAKEAYRVCGKEGNIVHFTHDGGHEWRGCGLMDFFKLHFGV